MFVSSTYQAHLNKIAITFDEPVTPDYSKMHIRDSGSSTGGITLGDITQTQITDNTIHVTLDETQKMTFGNLTAPQLDIDAGAVSDTSSNPIVATTGSANHPR